MTIVNHQQFPQNNPIPAFRATPLIAQATDDVLCAVLTFPTLLHFPLHQFGNIPAISGFTCKKQ
ncbi:hypothetical protein [Erwinia sp. V71]|uniref:hypothetical protein n=1 Tax=Erwinia sp. V71 TaxID=3369424 RepID=UPI003F625D2E